MSLDMALLLVRGVVGLTLAAHGSQKLFGWFGGSGFAGASGMIEKMGFRPGRFWAMLATGSEFGGGLALALGFLMPLPALGILAAMLIAVGKVHWKNGFWGSKGGIEYPLLLMILAAVLGLVGPGRYSLDTLLGIALPLVPVFWGGLLAALLVLGVGLVTGRRPVQQSGHQERAA